MGISGLLLGFCIGAGIVSGATYIIDSGHGFSGKALGLAVLAGAFGALGMSCVSFALTKYETPLSVLAPIFNANTLITVLVALWLFSEWKHVQVHQLIIGAILIVAGSTLVARA